MDLYDGADWTEMDIEDLKSAIEHGRTVEEAAQFLCRADSVDDVVRKIVELGLAERAFKFSPLIPAGSADLHGVPKAEE